MRTPSCTSTSSAQVEGQSWGQALRAAAVNRFGARLVGIRTETAGALAFTLAALIGAFSGILIGPVTTLYYDSGFLIGLKGFAGAVIGGYGIMYGAIVGSMGLGIIETFTSGYISSTYKDVISFLILIIFLAIRPRGILHCHVHDE